MTVVESALDIVLRSPVACSIFRVSVGRSYGAFDVLQSKSKASGCARNGKGMAGRVR